MSNDTPLIDDLEKGPWPSFVTEIKRAAKQSATDRVDTFKTDLCQYVSFPTYFCGTYVDSNHGQTEICYQRE